MKKIAVIKLGAKGDVLRTLPIVKAIKEKHKDSVICWITKGEIKEILNNQPYIDKVVSIPHAFTDEFDMLYNFDIDEEATTLAKEIKAKEKYGFSDTDGFASTFNLGAEYYLNTLFDDEIKKYNKKTYQEMMFSAAELPPNKELVKITLDNESLAYAEKFLSEKKVNKNNLIGIHMGASPRWPSKIWHEKSLMKFISLAKQKSYEILLFGGPNEAERQNRFIQDLKKEGIEVFANNPNNTARQFAALVNSCRVLVCSDSFALHMALALGKQTIGLFFCTSPNEVEDYGLLKKTISPRLYEFFPEKMDQYDEELTKSIKPEQVISIIESLHI